MKMVNGLETPLHRNFVQEVTGAANIQDYDLDV